MADSDPISEGTPNKRQKLGNGRYYDSQDDSGDELTAEDFHTIDTVPLQQSQRGQKRQLGYSVNQFHTDIDTSKPSQQQSARLVTQPTQPLRASSSSSSSRPPQQSSVTQPTQPLLPRTSSPPRSEILVDRSSPVRAPQSRSPPAPNPAPIRRVFARPSFLANSMAPPGTAFRRPAGVQPKPITVNLDSDDDDDDPPIHHSSDEEETQSALKPTHFKQGSRAQEKGPTSPPNISSGSIVRESPRAAGAAKLAANGNGNGNGKGGSAFLSLMSDFGYNSKQLSSAGHDSASAYASASRGPRPAPTSKPTVAPAAKKPPEFKKLDDLPDWQMRGSVIKILDVMSHESIQRCADALSKNKGNVEDAVAWLMEHEDVGDAPGSAGSTDELASTSPVPKRGVAVSKAYATQSSQPVRPSVKQQVSAPRQTIAEKYRRPEQSHQRESITIIDDDDEEEEEALEEVKPRRRLLQGRKGGRKSPTPPSSPPIKRIQKKPAVVISDVDSDSEMEEEDQVDEAATADHDDRLLRFFNECSVRDVVDLCNQPEETVKFVLDKRPFRSLDAIRDIALETKTGKKSRARPIGDKLVDDCSEMRTGFDAVGELVDECERIAKPIQTTLKGWGVSSSPDGELQMMNLDDSHDSGIGTPASSEDVPIPHRKKDFLGQPKSMSTEVTLKDYQLVGLNWLNLLWSKKISCILADDMGLGKTCQIIAFLAHLQEKKVTGVHLIIVPGSTLENWLREFNRFAPNLEVRPYYGSQSERAELRVSIDDDFDVIDVVITTYDIAVKKDDSAFLRKKVNPMVTVYDEAHVLRNTQTDRYKQLIRIPATFRVLLTGTPLQNNLQELVAILAFIMPDLFDQKKEELQYIFKHKASTKDADHAALLSSQRIARARAMITPFILRRKKQQVLDLPAKLRRVEYCDMTPKQADYYNELLAEAQRAYADKLEGKPKPTRGAAKKNSSTSSSGATTLMALREVAIHPLLRLHIYDDKKLEKIATELLKREWAGNPRDRVLSYLKGEHPQSFKGGDFGLHRFCAERSDYLSRFELRQEEWMDSGKVAKFAELVSGFAEHGDRVLVFSQFTSLMDILEAVLDTLAIKFLRLDGSTEMSSRQDLIDRFYSDASIPVFMLSTRAGGAGVNLACANKVIIFDSGFNPQDDIQAENRAHRVGQTREVEVVRLVTRRTIEEQIYALGESKLALDERVAAAGDGGEGGAGKGEEESGKKAVEEMFLESLKGKENGSVSEDHVDEKGVKEEGDVEEVKEEKKKGGKSKAKASANGDLRDIFKSGLEDAGVDVRSKQARY